MNVKSENVSLGSDETVKSKVTHDPGWNDPPVFSYDAVNATVQSKTPKRGLLLNKRVAFPLSSQPPSNVPPTTNNVLPPLSNSSTVSGILPCLPTTAGSTVTLNNTVEGKGEQNLQKEESLKTVMDNFEEILKTAGDDLKKNGVEIRRRLDVMNKMWEEDKLKVEIYLKMVQLSEALRNGNGELADHIHMGLMVDHVSLCSPWMVGVRQLIHHVKSKTVKQDESTEDTVDN